MKHRELTDAEKAQVAAAVEGLGEVFGSEVTGKDDDELVNIQPIVDLIADACHQPRLDLGDDAWVTAGEVRRRVRMLNAAMARGEV